MAPFTLVSGTLMSKDLLNERQERQSEAADIGFGAPDHAHLASDFGAGQFDLPLLTGPV